MINYLNKNITTVDRGIIAHGCNAQGVMGSGVAKFLKDKYPEIFPTYENICLAAKNKDSADSLLGTVDVVNVKRNLFVANCFTQHLYGYNKPGTNHVRYAQPEAIQSSLAWVFKLAEIVELPVYLPKIGAGRGGLDWNTEVEPIVQEFVNTYDMVDTYVCVWME